MGRNQIWAASFILGSFALCFLSLFQKVMAGYPVLFHGFWVPFWAGGFFGLLIGMHHYKLKKTLNKLQKVYGDLALKVRVQTNELCLNENMFHSMYESSALGVAKVSLDHKIEQANKAYCRMLGYDEVELIGKTLQEITAPDDVLENVEKQNKLRNGEISSYQMEKRFIHKDGRIVWGILNANLIHDYKGDAEYCLGNVIDITERKRAEQALFESEKKYRELAESLPQIIFETDGTGNIIYINQNVFDLFRYDKDEMNEDLNIIQMIIPEDRDRARKNIQSVLNGMQSGGVEYTALRCDNTTFPVVIHSSLVTRNGKPTGLRGLLIDISQQKQMETDLKRRALAMDHSSDAIVVADTNGSIIYVNPAFEKITGYSHEEVLGKNPRILQSGIHDKFFYKELWERLSNGKTWSGRFINKRKNGSQYAEDATISPVFSDKGKIVNYVAVKRDVSEKLEFEAQLRQAQKMEAIGALAGGIAHDFNNILFPIVGFAEMLEEDLPKNSDLRENVHEILAGAKRAKDLIQQILTFSRQAEQDIKPLKPHLVIKEVAKLIRSTIPATIEIKKYIDPETRSIMADPTQIHQVAMNLITNAYHAMQESGGVLTIRLENIESKDIPRQNLNLGDGPHVLLSISDTGSGMEKIVLEKIFDPYFTTKPKGKGTGLGLSVVHGIVTNYGGDISVNSFLGQGTEFNIYIPAVKKEIQLEQDHDIKVMPTGNEHILLVDDEKQILRIEQMILERLGYKVEPKSSSLDALKTIKANPNSYDLIISDMTMPNMTGDQLAQKIMNIKPEMPIIICTGFSETISMENIKLMGVKALLMKPIIRSEIALTVRKVLDEAKGAKL